MSNDTRLHPHHAVTRHIRATLSPLWRKFALGVALLLTASTTFAYQPPPGTTPDESDLSNHGTYQNRDGDTVHSPARSLSGKVPDGATARCRDGSYSFSRHHRGTCSGHGGVAQWL